MTTYFTIWHYAVVITTGILFLLLVILSFKETRPKNRNSMIFASFLVMSLVTVFLILALDKYTKKAELYGLKNRRLLATEKIVYSGYVKNTGNYTIGQVKVEFKIVNRGHVTGNVKAGSYFRPSGLFDFFGGGGSEARKVQKIEETIVVATDLEPGKIKYFNVTLDFPPHFVYVSDFQRVFAH